MKGFVNYFLIVFSSLLIVSCAAGYKSISPKSQNYMAHDLQDGVSISYRYDILQEAGNKKYAKKEDTKGIKLIAVKITNNTDSVICIGKNAAFFSGGNQLFPMDPLIIKQEIKQSAASYLFFLLLTPLKLYVTSDNKTETYQIGYFVGPGIALGNVMVASAANTEFEKELVDYNILYRDIQKGETVYGIIGFKNIGYLPISVKKVNI